MIVDPWGLVLATAPDAETAIVAELDFEVAARRAAPPAGRSRNRRPDAYAWEI